MLTKAKIFLYCCLSLIFGVGIASWLPAAWLSVGIIWFCLMLGLGVLALVGWNKQVKIIALIGLFLFLGIWRYSLSLPEDQLNKIWHYQGQNVVFVGSVMAEPEERPKNTQLTLQVRELAGNIVHGKVLIITEHYPHYEYGDLLSVDCNLQTPMPFEDFDYHRYLARSDIYVLCFYPEILVVGHESGWYNYILAGKQRVREIINLGLSEPEAGLGQAIILGYNRELPAELRLTFSRVGLSHLTSISGLHIGILAVLILNFLLLLGLNRKHTIYYSTSVLSLYIVMIGAPASAVRAGLMGGLALLAMHLGRLHQATNALVFAATVMLLINPRVLRDDVGFQLSFLAVLGIVLIYPRLKKFVQQRIKIKSRVIETVLDILLITIAAQVFTLPIVAYNFQIVSLVSPLANILVVWSLSVLLMLMIVAAFLSWLMPGLSVILFLPSFLILKYIIVLSEFLSKLPGAFIAW